MIKTITFMAILTTLLLSGCKKDKPANLATLKKLYESFKNGDIEECKLNGTTVYVAGINAYDAGSEVYDKEGNKIGTCNYAWRNVDPVCGEVRNCEVIYRCENHISGNPPIDKYGLGK